MKKSFWLCAILVLIISGLFFFYERKPAATIKEENWQINQPLTINQIIESVKNGTLVNGEEVIDTSECGNFDVEVKLLSKHQKENSVTVTVRIEDTIAPELIVPDTVFVNEFEVVDFTSQVSATDNSLKEVIIEKVNDYDANVIGVQQVVYQATDGSGNVSTKSIRVIVEQKVVWNSEIELSAEVTYFETNNGFLGYTKNGVTYVEGIIIANKTYTLPKQAGNGIVDVVQKAFNEMKATAKEDGCNIYIISGYRSFARQVTIYSKWWTLQGQQHADTHSSRPGHSEHQTGYGMDLNSLNRDWFKDTDEAKWLAANAWKYGFALRFVENKDELTGYGYEPWHYRYVGKELAEKLYNNGDWLAIEEYFGIDSLYNYDFNPKDYK